MGLGSYYNQGFRMNTWINGIYCTGMSAEEVNKELLKTSEAPFLLIQGEKGEKYKISSEKLGLQFDYLKQLHKLYEEQKSRHWLAYTESQTQIEFVPEITVDVESVLTDVSELDFVKADMKVPREVKIEKGPEGYLLKNTLNHRLDESVLYEYISEKLLDQEYLSQGYQTGCLIMDLADAGCYNDVPLSDEQKAVVEQWKIIEPYVHCGIIFDMGDKMIPIAGKIASDFILTDSAGNIAFDQSGHPQIDNEAIENYINSLADEYNTWKKELKFTSTAGDEKSVPYVNYGTEIDTKKETAYLKDAFREKRTETHIPAYKHEGYVRGKNDIGDTYIEVDMGNQRLYAYLDGELLVETEIVSGNVKRKMATPEGVVHIYRKQRNRTLRGPGYASFVKYWMPVKGGIGLHDANWRKKFGGEIYKTDGSHGCINIPRSVMTDIYDNFEVGTPVILFY